MKEKCFEIGAIQAFLDGETTPDVSLRLADHIAACDRCSQLMAVAEDESSLVFSALERELDTLVPTQRLWVRINDSIAEEKSRAPYWQKIYAYLCISLANPSLTAAAGIVLVLGIFALVTVKEDAGPEISDRGPDRETVGKLKTDSTPVNEPTSRDIASNADDSAVPATTRTKAAVQISNHSPKELRAIVKPPITPQRTVYTDSYMPGEESYVKTIADLKQNVDEHKDTVMTPSTRVSYERDMAVVNDSIKRMREAVRKNPRNQAARQVLYSSYQDKIDLLNSVAQREELLVSLR